MATSASQSYVWFNSLINVDNIKVDMDITKTFEQAVAQKEWFLRLFYLIVLLGR